MIEKDYISNAGIIQELAKNGNFEKYGINSKEELELLIETIPNEYNHIKSALEIAWEYKNNNSSQSLFEIRNRLIQEIKYLQIHDYLLKKNIKIDYSKLRENVELNELDNFVELVTKSTTSLDEKLRGLKQKEKNDYFSLIESMNRIKTIRNSFEEQIKKIDNAINRTTYLNRSRNKSK